MTSLLFLVSNLFWLISSCPALYLSLMNFRKVITSGANGDRRMTAFVFMNLSSSISLALLTLTLVGWNAFLHGKYSPPWQDAILFQITTLLLFGLGPFLGFSSLFVSFKLSALFEMAEKSDTDGEKYGEAIKQSDIKKNQAYQVLKYSISI